jgi:hypothetical protein
MKIDKQVIVSYSEGESWDGKWKEGMQINIDKEPYAFYRESEVFNAFQTLKSLQEQGYTINFK